MSTHLDRAKTLQNSIRKILVTEWDPIGIKDVPEAQDEYDSYISSIYNLLIAKKPEHEIFDFLWWVETEHMGLIANKQRTQTIAKMLSALN